MEDFRPKSVLLLLRRLLEKTMFFKVLEKEMRSFREKMIPASLRSLQKNPQITASHKSRAEIYTRQPMQL